MHIHFLGATQTMAGSCYIIEAAGSRFAVDCGMHQGNPHIELRNYETALYRASALDFILLTHAHIDHSGLLPRMVAEKFQSPVYCTDPTRDLLGIMLEDSAHIQEMEAEWANRKRARRGAERLPPLYTLENANAVLQLLSPTRYQKTFEPAPGIQARFSDAGHILGSSFLEITIAENNAFARLVFSGDLGRPDAFIVNKPAMPERGVDYLFLESTYGDRNHKNEKSSLDELAEAIHYSTSRNEKTIIPAFAVERTQEVLYLLYLLHQQGKLPEGIPVFVDSPLAIKATQIFLRYPEYFNSETQRFFSNGAKLPGLTYTPGTSESQSINSPQGPAIIISASGMCNAGRIKHHLRHNLWRPGASIVFTGYQAVGTPGRKIVDGAKSITILGDEIAVRARVFTIGGFSGHAGQSQLLEWVAGFQDPAMRVFLVHGEEKSQQILATLLRERFGFNVQIPAYLERIHLPLDKTAIPWLDSVVAPPKIKWEPLLADTEKNAAALRLAAQGAKELPWAEQAELQEQILTVNKQLAQILSSL